MITKNLINIAYEIAKKDFKNKEFDFNDLVSKVIVKAEVSEQAFYEQIGDFYTNLLQDVRFVFSGNNKWTLKENLKVAEYQIKMNSLYDFEQNDLIEDYDQNPNEIISDDKTEDDEIIDNEIEYDYDHEDDDTDDEDNYGSSLDDEEIDDTDINEEDEEF